MLPPPAPSSVILTLDDIRRWKEECAEIEKEIDRLIARRSDLERRLEAATLFMSPDIRELIFPRKQGSENDTSTLKWTTYLHALLQKAGRGLTHDELRAEVRMGPLAEKLISTEKSYHGALGKLRDRGLVKSHNGRFYDMDAFRRYQEELAAGRISEDDEPPVNRRSSDFQKEALRIIERHPEGIVSSDIIHELSRTPDFAQAINRNKTYAYNVLSTLVRRGDLIKEGKAYRLSPKNEAADADPDEGTSTASERGIFD